jgi:hypothetical protein
MSLTYLLLDGSITVNAIRECVLAGLLMYLVFEAAICSYQQIIKIAHYSQHIWSKSIPYLGQAQV